MRLIAQGLQRFKSDDNGTIAVIFGLIAVVFVAFGGISIDLARTYGASSRAGAGLDAAILAAGDARNRYGLNDTELAELAEKHFLGNIQGAGNRINEYSNFNLSISNGGDTFTATVDVKVPMNFAGLVSLDEVSFTATSSATFDQLDLELGLMLDVTGSMNENVPGSAGSKLQALKRAVSQDLLDTLLPNGDNPKIRVGYAPYSAAVNVGPLAAVVRDPSAAFSDNCVVERDNNMSGEVAPDGRDYFRTINEANTTLTRDRHNDGRYEFYRCPNAQVQPLTSDKAELVNTINSYRAGGYTAGHLGIAWAWYLVSPEWASIWGNESRPKPYGTPKLIKAVVLLTDGQFNTAYDGSDYNTDATPVSYTRAAELCNNIQNRDVVVYSIGFAIPAGSQAANALKGCASRNPESGRKLFFAAANETDLRNAFQEIAQSLTNLRLTQ